MISFASMGRRRIAGPADHRQAVGHFQPATTARYSHLDADPLRRALHIIGNQIAVAMDGKRGDVVQLHGRK
jgi:hypothetical protein